jgi:hypothetical protein
MPRPIPDVADESYAEHWFVRGRYQGAISTGAHVLSRFVAPVSAYLAMFVGTGFLSGAIVHSGDTSQIPRNAIIAAIGMCLFVVGSTFYEAVVLQHRITRRTLGSFLVFSSLLSVGIGMISGGVQHFTDFPMFAPKLIPLGLLLATFAFGFKHRVELHGRWWAVVAATSATLSLCLFAVTTTIAKPYVAAAARGEGGHSHSATTTSASHEQKEAAGAEASPATPSSRSPAATQAPMSDSHDMTQAEHTEHTAH